MGNKTDSIGFGTAIILLIIAITVNAYIISYFYEWFLMKPFVLPKLNLWQFAGLSTFYAFLNTKNEEPKNRDSNETIALFIFLLLTKASFFLIGYIIYRNI